ncbi:hypothetical protein Pelo_8592 [Pelomyxa schiedti]|nr:hypothetical protein Pelo_8592 [Pelomyxa schiedti]
MAFMSSSIGSEIRRLRREYVIVEEKRRASEALAKELEGSLVTNRATLDQLQAIGTDAVRAHSRQQATHQTRHFLQQWVANQIAEVTARNTIQMERLLLAEKALREERSHFLEEYSSYMRLCEEQSSPSWLEARQRQSEVALQCTTIEVATLQDNLRALQLRFTFGCHWPHHKYTTRLETSRNAGSKHKSMLEDLHLLQEKISTIHFLHCKYKKKLAKTTKQKEDTQQEIERIQKVLDTEVRNKYSTTCTYTNLLT